MSSSVHAIIVISIHAAREGGDRYGARLQPLFAISIHAAREGGDASVQVQTALNVISIHAAREGGDPVWLQRSYKLRNFNPRRP